MSLFALQRESVVTRIVVVIVSVCGGLILPWWLYGILAVVCIVTGSFYAGPILGALVHDIVYGSVSLGGTDTAYVLSLGVTVVAVTVLFFKPRFYHSHENI